jgi:hypothetical protein
MNEAADMRLDMRLPVVFGGVPGEADAVLLENGRAMPAAGYVMTLSLGTPVPGHKAGCACCAPRTAAGQALGALFRERATGAAPLFSRVVVLAAPDGEAAIRRAIRDDVIAAARYRLA